MQVLNNQKSQYKHHRLTNQGEFSLVIFPEPKSWPYESIPILPEHVKSSQRAIACYPGAFETLKLRYRESI